MHAVCPYHRLKIPTLHPCVCGWKDDPAASLLFATSCWPLVLAAAVHVIFISAAGRHVSTLGSTGWAAQAGHNRAVLQQVVGLVGWLVWECNCAAAAGTAMAIGRMISLIWRVQVRTAVAMVLARWRSSDEKLAPTAAHCFPATAPCLVCCP